MDLRILHAFRLNVTCALPNVALERGEDVGTGVFRLTKLAKRDQ